jgi:hypothetical protein
MFSLYLEGERAVFTELRVVVLHILVAHVLSCRHVTITHRETASDIHSYE